MIEIFFVLSLLSTATIGLTGSHCLLGQYFKRFFKIFCGFWHLYALPPLSFWMVSHKYLFYRQARGKRETCGKLWGNRKDKGHLRWCPSTDLVKTASLEDYEILFWRSNRNLHLMEMEMENFHYLSICQHKNTWGYQGRVKFLTTLRTFPYFSTLYWACMRWS